MNPPTVVIVPGLRDHVPQHWQTLLADRLDDARLLPPLETDRLNRHAHVAVLQRTLAQILGPVVLVAHSAGVITTVHWAAQHHHEVRGALLATPPDLTPPLLEGHPSPDALHAGGWTPVPMKPLPFPASSRPAPTTPWPPTTTPQMCVPHPATPARSKRQALGPVGHLNPASGYGTWERAEEFVRELS
ncbi:RBBP9/YdeN family alpha/beta hydrolase [Streptomyces cavernicola]|uniref:Alpha/beta hydrolase n=1 Tax=Streptomyces cavernicola TaxID=3043613 RepID=A0ABT6SLP6_9ACTN|nr:alpha/beta hydrolase [Streptomyces sp. B-S-A6]MDI3408146.1 alpha/beta hydrolase [Streptomyces sp. B-S-A6]